MPLSRMHADEARTDAPLVRRLLATQFPRWAELPIEAVESAGTDNAMYRLGDDMAVRLPRIASAAAKVDKEQRWLPVLAPLLPLAIPQPLSAGAPSEDYPWSWSVTRWLQGNSADRAPISDLRRAAVALAEFILSIQRVDPSGGPVPGAQSSGRGAPLALRDPGIRRSIEALQGDIDTSAATAAWDCALDAREWESPPVWFHGDLLPGNLLVTDGRLSGVIDFGAAGVGDPACDLVCAWSVLRPETRATFRDALGVDDATWDRGRGWALFVGLSGLPYYRETNPEFAQLCGRMIEAVLADPSASRSRG